mmetsp:Transcript_21708/g.33200  ORF Transcript_21708/g.33200 Transcript_21708/m.33200 type:complete len:342 (-) Transcript_21708:115-1140(-)|eukprot:CAMPEP_0196811172 /NCGR_PEP_ID=MMETSP1362-20130617/16991_1 /TAXON_ID=163516 /ORGANISM="Leptocylindrus danicus, Strain CCMP1856" /LENGTH=341 /DNA_ID=CAMNT_0042186435 /DNA_START=283 /DNA_END=1308 /DNA_ORIENTATION=+
MGNSSSTIENVEEPIEQKQVEAPEEVDEEEKHVEEEQEDLFVDPAAEIETGKVYHFQNDDFPHEIAQSLDAIFVLGGGVPSSVTSPPEYVKLRCDAAVTVCKHMSGVTGDMPAIVCLSAGTAHLPQLLSDDGLPVWEATASAAYILDNNDTIPEEKVFAETTSYDTISNAYFARTSHAEVAGWRNILIITSEFHMDRSKAIFDWIFHAESPSMTSAYKLHYLACDNIGLSEEAVKSRKEHEARGALNIQENISQKFKSLREVWYFLTQYHDFFAAGKLVKRAKVAKQSDNTTSSLKDSYGAASVAKSEEAVEVAYQKYGNMLMAAGALAVIASTAILKGRK